MSNNYVLYVKPGYVIDFIMLTEDGYHVQGWTTFESAKTMLTGKVRSTDDVDGYPLTADGKYFFPGFLEDV